MKANIPRAFQTLPKGERDRIVEHARNIALRQTEVDARIMLDLYIKMVCITLHDAFGFGESRLLAFLGNHQRLFHTQREMVKNDTQIEYLNRRMAEIFKKSGFPKQFFDNMLGEVKHD